VAPLGGDDDAALTLLVEAVGKKGCRRIASGAFSRMGARFIGGDREQVFLMPPSVRDFLAARAPIREAPPA
jgi:hypothetical protein